MRKSLSIVATAVEVAAIASLWSGCASQHTEQNRPLIYNEPEYNTRDTAAQASRTDVPRYTEAETPPAPAPAPKVVAKPAPPSPGCGPNEFTLKSDLLQLHKQVPARASLGQTVENTIVVDALDNCADVVITDTISDGATYVKSEPSAQVSGRKLTWTMDTLDKGQQVTIKVWYKADKEGCLANCATMVAIPRGCARTLVGSAKLVLSCQLPASVTIGSAINKTIEVKNVGTAPASDVVVTDTLSEGLSNASGQPLTFNVGELGPGQSKQITVPLKAAKRGQASNAVVARASNASEANSQCATVINQPGLDIAKSGTKEQFLGRQASYEIVVSNTGDIDLQNVVVTDTAPAATKLVAASGASVSGNTATWTLTSLKTGGKQTFNVVVTTMTPGSHCNNVTVKTAEGLSGSAQACTLWKGVPAILLETKDDPDPISVGETTTYTIRVTNQGTADDNNVKVVATFAKEVDPVSATGGTVSGKTVTFTPVPTLAAKQVVTYTITAKGAAAGDHRLKVNLTSDMLTEPVTHEESTHVY
jgi:uncharacterized repeat protein (TIGR01451 family)